LAVALVAGVVSGCTSDGGSTEAFCAQVAKVPSLESVLSRFSEADTTVLDDRIDQARTAYADLAEAAPKAIDDETDEVVSLVDDILDAVEQHPTDPAKAATQLRKAMAAHKGIDADRAKVAAYAQKQCDVQLDPTLSEGTGTSSTTGGTVTTTAPETATTGN
jgi:hypothetical protein